MRTTAKAETLLFTENETNTERLVGTPNPSPYVKDGIGNYIVHGKKDAVNPEKKGTKVSAHYPLKLGAGESGTIRLRLSDRLMSATPPHPPLAKGDKGGFQANPFGRAFAEILMARLEEADDFYATVIPPSFNPDAAQVMRQALAGMLWSKQFFFYKVGRWLKQHGIQPYKANPRSLSIECPTGSGKQMNLYEVAEEIGGRLSKVFLKDEQGKRPVHGASRKFQEDPHWRDYPLFYEYFRGDTGAGVGASHQTGWSGAIARVMHLFASSDAQKILEQSKEKSAGGTPQPGKKR